MPAPALTLFIAHVLNVLQEHTSAVRLLTLCLLCGVVRYRQFQVDALVLALLFGDVGVFAFLARARRFVR